MRRPLSGVRHRRVSHPRRPASSQSPLSFVSAQRRRKLHPLPCSSFPHRTRFAGLRRGPHFFAVLPCNLLRRLWAPALGVQAFGLCLYRGGRMVPPGQASSSPQAPYPSLPSLAKAHPFCCGSSPHKNRCAGFLRGPISPGPGGPGGAMAKAYGCRRPEAVGGTGVAAGSGRRKEKHAVQLSGGYPGGPPPGHALWVLSLVQEKVPRLSGRDPTSQKACRNPPAKRYPVRKALANSPCFSPGKRVK